MFGCHTKPIDSKTMIRAVGQNLVRRRGKQSYYSVRDVQKSVVAMGYPLDVACWAMAVFSSPLDFKSHHDSAGETCDYFAMRADILPELASKRAFSLPDFDGSTWPDFDLSWLEWPDVDWSELFSGELLNPFQWFDGV